MNESYYELRAIWPSPRAPSMNVDRIICDVEQKWNEFKSMIAFRDWREMGGGALCHLMYRQHNVVAIRRISGHSRADPSPWSRAHQFRLRCLAWRLVSLQILINSSVTGSKPSDAT